VRVDILSALMACLMRFGSLPPATNPDRPTKAQFDPREACRVAVFDTH
jgi:hypothetical protein